MFTGYLVPLLAAAAILFHRRDTAECRAAIALDSTNVGRKPIEQ